MRQDTYNYRNCATAWNHLPHDAGAFREGGRALEIYNETIRDLLNPNLANKQGLMLREDANQVVSVAGLSSHNPQNVQQVMDMVIQGNSNRTQSPTEANATSSRSHAVLQVNVSSKSRDTSVQEPVTMATLSIIDLAGSERRERISTNLCWLLVVASMLCAIQERRTTFLIVTRNSLGC
jgi:hypothetical protein